MLAENDWLIKNFFTEKAPAAAIPTTADASACGGILLFDERFRVLYDIRERHLRHLLLHGILNLFEPPIHDVMDVVLIKITDKIAQQNYNVNDYGLRNAEACAMQEGWPRRPPREDHREICTKNRRGCRNAHLHLLHLRLRASNSYITVARFWTSRRPERPLQGCYQAPLS